MSKFTFKEKNTMKLTFFLVTLLINTFAFGQFSIDEDAMFLSHRTVYEYTNDTTDDTFFIKDYCKVEEEKFLRKTKQLISEKITIIDANNFINEEIYYEHYQKIEKITTIAYE